ncbi:hypothetical protein HBB16_10035 [Pseudonocardia sp. MCCB 268]|nr:hypothetical protein [Pseudonocardia cytotoxica]
MLAALPGSAARVLGEALLWGGISGLGAEPGDVALYRPGRRQMAVAGQSRSAPQPCPVLVGLLLGELALDRHPDRDPAPPCRRSGWSPAANSNPACGWSGARRPGNARRSWGSGAVRGSRPGPASSAGRARPASSSPRRR